MHYNPLLKYHGVIFGYMIFPDLLMTRAGLLAVVGRSSIDDLKCLTLGSYHRLVSFLVKRDGRRRRILTNASIPFKSTCKCYPEKVYGMINRDFETPHLSTDEIYLKALEHSHQDCSALDEECALLAYSLRKFVDLMAKEMDTTCNKLMW